MRSPLNREQLGIGIAVYVYVYNCISAHVHALHHIYQHSEAHGSVNMYSRIQEIILNSLFPTACLYPFACVVLLQSDECEQVKAYTRLPVAYVYVCLHALCPICIQVVKRSQRKRPRGNTSRQALSKIDALQDRRVLTAKRHTTNPTLNQSNSKTNG